MAQKSDTDVIVDIAIGVAAAGAFAALLWGLSEVLKQWKP